jgi:altronate dehydratase large subunit
MGNIEGGITTLEEKSLGAYLKAGHRKFAGVLNYSEKPDRRGLFVMDSPGFDIESMTGMAAGGAQIIAFTTGRGSPVGSAVSPVFKITANKQTYRRMRENIDFYAGDVIKGSRGIETTGEELFQQILQVASGKITAAERFGFNEFSIYRLRSSV